MDVIKKEVIIDERAEHQIDVRKIQKPPERIKKVSDGLGKIEKGDQAEIIADDPRMLRLALKIIERIESGKFVKTWEGDDGYFHTLVEKE